MQSLLFFLAISTSSVIACPQHDLNARGHINKRASGTQDWAYEASYNWGMLNQEYVLCQAGTQQAPIPLLTTQGFADTHIPTFDEESYKAVPGEMFNWGYGPAFTNNGSSKTGRPSMTFDNTTVYLKGLHIHAPGDHTVQGDRSKAELHLVHANPESQEKAVMAIRIDPGTADSKFFSQLLSGSHTGSSPAAGYATGSDPADPAFSMVSAVPNFDSQATLPMTLDVLEALREVNMFSDFWTYSGSLTSPPCTEGIRFWVARNPLYVSVRQMQAILAVSTYSARAEQEVWLHAINT
ncbi:hypothetical protein LZ554_002835 [Drepanopeziza brunnea f. sp. 'monogermtubi']|nr:hypothetical protein LZ554_002835 [Drepanopeziza brunnea f. sp. 'monogermtubi']